MSVYDLHCSTRGRETQVRLLIIGAFARRLRLSPMALRLYARHGILVPAHVDQENGYLRYHESQLGAARLIAMLRQIDMPLAQVAFPQILSAYEAVDQWIRLNCKQMSASPREVHFADWDAFGRNDEVCDVAFPIE